MDGERQMTQYAVVVVGIFEGHILKDDLPLGDLQWQRIGCIGDFYWCVHDFKEPLDAGDAPLKLLGKFYNAADSGDEGGDVEHVGHQITRRNGAVDHKETAAQDDHHVHQAVKEAGGGLEQGHKMISLCLDVFELLIASGKFFTFLGFCAKSLDDLFSQKAVFNLGV